MSRMDGGARRSRWSMVQSILREEEEEAIRVATYDGTANDGQFVDTLVRRCK